MLIKIFKKKETTIWFVEVFTLFFVRMKFKHHTNFNYNTIKII